jgi:uncharacterized membrane protein YjdF
MGSSQTKEEVIIPQNAAGGSNSAQVDELRYHLSTTNILMGIVVICVCLGVMYTIFRIYRKCHFRWIRQEIDQNRSRGRSSFHRRQMYPDLKIDDSKV